MEVFYSFALFLIFFIKDTKPQEGLSTRTLNLDSNFQEIEMLRGEMLRVKLALSEDTEFSIVAAHAYQANNLKISYNSLPSPPIDTFTTGSDIGLLLVRGKDEDQVYITNDNNNTVQVLIVLQTYDFNAPVPGYCNMELPLKRAPFLPNVFDKTILSVEYPLGSWPLIIQPQSCDRAHLQYDIYHYYLQERDLSSSAAFEALRLMSDVGSIEANARKVEFNGVPPSKVLFANYPSTGRIVAIVVRSLTSSAAYVPIISYGCLPNSTNDDISCEVLTSTWSKIFSAALVFVGLFLTFFGHRYYKSHIFLFGFCIFAFASIIIGLALTEMNNEVVVGTSITAGIIGGALWLILWAKCGSPLPPVFLSSLIKGILLASVVAYTPLADIYVMKDDGAFWIAFLSLVLVVPLVLVSFTRFSSIFCSSVVGSFIFILPLDHYVGSNLRFILINTMKRATEPSFRTSIIDPPFQKTDLILVIVWALLSMTGTLFQLWRERGHPPFPPAPTWPSSRSRSERFFVQRTLTEDRIVAGRGHNSEAYIVNERTPLILPTAPPPHS